MAAPPGCTAADNRGADGTTWPTNGAPSENLKKAASPPFRFRTSWRFVVEPEPLTTGMVVVVTTSASKSSISTAVILLVPVSKLSLIVWAQLAAVLLVVVSPLTTII